MNMLFILKLTPHLIEFDAGIPLYLQNIQLLREKLSEKVHATIPKSIVGSFEFTVLQRNLTESHERPWTYLCEC